MMAETRKPQEWAAADGILILDPDGWRGPDSPPFDQPCTREEYQRRVGFCTVATEDDTERVERVAQPRWALRHPGGDEDWGTDWTEASVREHVRRHPLAAGLFGYPPALSPAQPDPATVKRARAEGRKQGLREAEQAVRAQFTDAVLVQHHGLRLAVDTLRALSSGTPSAPEGTL